MEYRNLGRTGIKVSPLCLGAMMFGGWGLKDHDESVKTIHYALDHGINFIDTADVYSLGESEEIVGKALKGRRDNVVLATKFFGKMGDDPNQQGGSRRWIIREVENSLRRLKTDYIDLYQIHRPDVDTDLEHTLSALTDLVRAGKIRHIGSSTWPATLVVESHWVAERRGLERFVCEQPPYSILERRIERDLLPTAQKYGMAVIPWSPLSGGWLTGKYRRGAGIPKGSRGELMPDGFDPKNPANAAKLDVVEGLADLARHEGINLTQLSLAWVLEHPAVTAPIIGLRSIAQLKEQLPAADIRLSTETLDAIDQLQPPGTASAPAGWDAPSFSAEGRRRPRPVEAAPAKGGSRAAGGTTKVIAKAADKGATNGKARRAAARS